MAFLIHRQRISEQTLGGGAGGGGGGAEPPAQAEAPKRRAVIQRTPTDTSLRR